MHAAQRAGGRGPHLFRLVALMCVSALALAGCTSDRQAGSQDPGSVNGSIALVPAHGGIEGGNLVFVDAGWTAEEAKGVSVTATFGEAAAKCSFDEKVNQFACTAPARMAPGKVAVALAADGEPVEGSASYAYTTHGAQDAPVLTINTALLQRNATAIQDDYPSGVLLGSVLKNGEPVGPMGKAISEAADVDYFFVPKLDDAIALRDAGVTSKIAVMYLTKIEDIPLLLHYDIEVAATDPAWVKEAEQALSRTDGELAVHLWIDTGMGREGVLPEDALPLAQAIEDASHLKLVGIATHFCCITENDSAALLSNDMTNQTVLQKNRFDTAVATIRDAGLGENAILHAGASDVLSHDLEPLYYDMLRVGGMFFVSSAPDEFIYSWKTSIGQVKTLPQGWCIDYTCASQTTAATKVGLISHIPSRDDTITFSVRGTQVPVLLNHGTVVTLDLTNVPDAAVGDEVTIDFNEDLGYLLDATPPVPVTL